MIVEAVGREGGDRGRTWSPSAARQKKDDENECRVPLLGLNALQRSVRRPAALSRRHHRRANIQRGAHGKVI